MKCTETVDFVSCRLRVENNSNQTNLIMRRIKKWQQQVPQIPEDDFRKSVQFIYADGSITKVAEDVFRNFKYANKKWRL